LIGKSVLPRNKTHNLFRFGFVVDGWSVIGLALHEVWFYY